MPSFGGSSLPGQFTEAGGRAFFAANDGLYGEELHLTDGTLLGTRLVRDLWPGAGGGSPRGLVALGNRVVFLASLPLQGSVPFASDGTVDGTRPLRSDLACFVEPVAAAGVVFLRAQHPSFGEELWRTDGTELGTMLVRDLVPGPSSPTFGPMVAQGSHLAFVVVHGITGELQLWRSDGTAAGTVLRVTLPGSAGRTVASMAADASGVWVHGIGGTGEPLWRSDLTAPGTRLVTTLPPGTFATGMLSSGARLFFIGNDNTAGQELWTSDGTAAGTRRVADIFPGVAGSSPASLVSLGSIVYFTADDGSRGRELWRSDGTAAGTTLVRDTGAGGMTLEPEAILAHAGRLVFGGSGQLWRSDGTTAGTVPVTAFVEPLGSVSRIRPFGAGYLFAANTTSSGQEPWITDLTAAGTRLLKDIAAPPGQGSIPMEITPLGNGVLFLANDGVGFGPWRSDGTPSGTAPAPLGVLGVFWLTPFGSRVLLNSGNGTGLHITDGTAAGTFEVSPAAGFNRPSRPVVAGAVAYFTAATANEGEELWRTDGTAAGTRLVRDIRPGPDTPQIFQVVAAGNLVFFTADDGVAGRELWVSDGTAAGTRLVRDITPGSGSSSVFDPTAVGTRLFFTTFTANEGNELWVSDGTAAGTRVIDLEPGAASSVPSQLAEFQGQCFFAASARGVFNALWRSDGTLAGTVLVRDEPSIGLSPTQLVVSGSRLFFTGNDATAGHELWTSDGTTAGTRLVKDITPGPAQTAITHLRSLGSGLVVFTAREPVFGDEAWRSDGTDLGTFLIADLARGAIDSAPDQYTLVGQTVFFTADDGLIGREPYAMPRNAAGGAGVESLGVGCARAGADPPRLDTTSLPQLGNANMRVVLDRGEPSSPASMLFAAQSAAIPLGGGCTLLLAPPILLTANLGNTTPLGTASLPLPVPNVAALVGSRLSLQAVVVQNGAPFLGLISFSQGLRLRLGR